MLGDTNITICFEKVIEHEENISNQYVIDWWITYSNPFTFQTYCSEVSSNNCILSLRIDVV